MWISNRMPIVMVIGMMALGVGCAAGDDALIRDNEGGVSNADAQTLLEGGLPPLPPPMTPSAFPCPGTEPSACRAGDQCDDGLRCNGINICHGEFGCVCDEGRPPVSCDDTVACTSGRCLEPDGRCVQELDHALCEDSNECTSDLCTLEGCQNTPVSDGTSCDAGAGRCFDGFCCDGCWDGMNCRPGTELSYCGLGGERCADCDDGDECSVDSCGPSGCTHEPVADGTPCAMGICQGGACCSGCFDGLTCHPGDTVAVCGIAGELCTACECPDTDTCNGGRCPPGRFAASTVSAGMQHSCAVTETGRLYCWGYRTDGRLGVGESPSGSELSPVRVGSEEDWARVATSYGSSCGIRAMGAARTLWCWGRNRYGEVGDGTTNPVYTPTLVSGGRTDWAEVGMGDDITCARTSGNTIWCWGYHYPLGSGLGRCGVPGDTTLPALVGGSTLRTGWVHLAVGYRHTCAIRAEGADRVAYCWGPNSYGKLGTGDIVHSSCPVRVAGGFTDWTSLAAGVSHTCGIRRDGTLWCWGYNGHGQLGIGSPFDSFTPTQVGVDRDWASVNASYQHTCAIRTDGRLYCWGRTDVLGIGTRRPDVHASPVRVGMDSDWAELSTLRYHTCATRTDGTLSCWGDNDQGKLGIGDMADRLDPTRACFPADMP